MHKSNACHHISFKYFKRPELELDERELICLIFKTKHDRDENAATNIRKESRLVL